MDPKLITIPLSCSCPKACTSCNGRITREWHHEKCHSRSNINSMGDIGCAKNCEPYFI